jgi:hypothetical protein
MFSESRPNQNGENLKKIWIFHVLRGSPKSGATIGWRARAFRLLGLGTTMIAFYMLAETSTRPCGREIAVVKLSRRRRPRGPAACPHSIRSVLLIPRGTRLHRCDLLSRFLGRLRATAHHHYRPRKRRLTEHLRHRLPAPETISEHTRNCSHAFPLTSKHPCKLSLHFGDLARSNPRHTVLMRYSHLGQERL